ARLRSRGSGRAVFFASAGPVAGGCADFNRARSRSFGEVELRNAIRLWSGDQIGFEAPLGRSVITQASPPESERTAICGGFGLPCSSFSPPRKKASRPPSGDQRGDTSCCRW